MAFDQGLAERIRDFWAERALEIHEKKMFGGLAFLFDGGLVCGILGDELMARVGAANYEEALKMPFVRPMDFTHRPMTGFVMVASEGLELDSQLEAWLNTCWAFHKTLSAPKAKRGRQK